MGVIQLGLFMASFTGIFRVNDFFETTKCHIRMYTVSLVVFQLLSTKAIWQGVSTECIGIRVSVQRFHEFL